jgi:predicted  nucleic acid-binding Zn-ribbon protein
LCLYRLKDILTDIILNETNHLPMSADTLNIDTRFDRLESKLDEVTKTLSELKRLDERMISSHKRTDRHERRLDTLESNQREIEKSIVQTESKSRVSERMFWVAFSVGLSAIVKNFF